MKVKLWGVRGSITTPGKETAKYGGNTPCVQVFNDQGDFVILDAGIGIVRLGETLNCSPYSEGKGEIHIILSHTHWDHIQGIPFFSPIFKSGNLITIYCNNRISRSIYDTIGYLFQSYYSPHSKIENVSAKFAFVEITEKDFFIKDLRFTPIPMVHPVTCLGYKIIDEKGNIFIYATDHELENEEDEKYVETLRNCDLLVHDTHFTETEYLTHKGWGHGSLERVINVSLKAEVKHLVLFHHAPEKTDTDLEKILEYSRGLVKGKMKISLAREGEEYPL